MFSFQSCDDIDLLNRGLVNLRGVNHDEQDDSNGSGKSSVFNALCEILYRSNPTGVSGDGVVNTVWRRGFAGRAVFTSWENIKYRVTYCRQWKTPCYESDNDNSTEYTGTAIFFDKFVSGGWVDCRGSSMKETQDRIQVALGLTYAQFLAVAYMTPRQGNIVLRGANKDRMDVLSGLVGLEVWDSILESTRHERKKVLAQKAEVEKAVSYLEGEINQLQIQIVNSSTKNILDEISTAQGKLKELKDLKATGEETLKVHQAQLVQIQEERAQVWASMDPTAHQTRLQELHDEISAHRVELNSCCTATNVGLTAELTEAERELSLAQGKLSAVKGENKLAELEKCPTCGSKVTKAARERMEKSIRTAEATTARCEKKAKDVRERVRNDRSQQDAEIAEKKNEIHGQLTQLEKKKAEMLDEHNKNLARYNSFEPRISALQGGVNNAQNYISSCVQAEANWNARIDALNKSVDAVKALETQLKTKQAECESKRASVAAVVQDVQHYDWLVTNIPYIKLHKLSVSLSDLSDLTNAYLRKMGDTSTVQISSFKEKKKATSGLKVDQLKGEISVSIVDGNKDIDTRLYSEGETARFSVALVRAMHDLANKHGQGCNLVLLDEIFGFVDKSNSQRIAGIFVEDFPPEATCIVTDNSGWATNLMNFDHTWAVTKENGLSQLKEN